MLSLSSLIRARDRDRSRLQATHTNKGETLFLHRCQNIGGPQTKHQGDTGGHVDLTDVV